ncbi:DUF6188 family protein [Nakamurella sp.]|uniref:DUF6188 family protein n=1 Tax=Nakamurella sp. TaxID=1869182 RepID=UPI003B3B62D4
MGSDTLIAVPDVIGDTVTQIRFDHAVTIVTDHSLLRIQTGFQFADGAGKLVIDPECARQFANRILGALHRTVESCNYSKVGTMSVGLAGGAAITVKPSARYEAWNFSISGDRPRLLVSKVGGGVAVWNEAIPS